MHSKHSQEDKKLADLRYATFVESLLAALPEIKARHDVLQDDIGPDVLPFPTVELVLEPFLRTLLTGNMDANLQRRAFAFLENMARSHDVEVVNLLHVGIFEHWAGESEILDHAWRHMGESTKRIATDAAHRLNCGDNLPRAARRQPQ